MPVHVHQPVKLKHGHLSAKPYYVMHIVKLIQRCFGLANKNIKQSTRLLDMHIILITSHLENKLNWIP